MFVSKPCVINGMPAENLAIRMSPRSCPVVIFKRSWCFAATQNRGRSETRPSCTDSFQLLFGYVCALLTF